MTNIPQSIQNSTVVHVSDRTPGMFQHGDERDTARMTVSRNPRWKARSAGGYQSNGLGARRTNMSYMPGLGSTFTDMRDALLNRASSLLDPTAAAAAPAAQAQQAAPYVAPSAGMPKWVLPAGIAAVAVLGFILLKNKK